MIHEEYLNVRLMEENVPRSSQTKYDMIPYVQLSLQGFCKCTHFYHLVLMVRVPLNILFSVLQFFYFIFQCMP